MAKRKPKVEEKDLPTVYKFIVPMEMAPGVQRASIGLIRPGQQFFWPDADTVEGERPNPKLIPVDMEGYELLSSLWAKELATGKINAINEPEGDAHAQAMTEARRRASQAPAVKSAKRAASEMNAPEATGHGAAGADQPRGSARASDSL